MKVEKSFESTLQRERDGILKRANKHIGTAQYREDVKEADVITNTPAFLSARKRAEYITKVIQPSIMENDLRIAITLQLAMACELVHNLFKEGVIEFKK